MNVKSFRMLGATSPIGRGRIASYAIRVRGYGLTIDLNPSRHASPNGRGSVLPLPRYRARKARPGFVRRVSAGLLALAAAAIASSDGRCDELLKAKVGVLRLSSSAPVFIAQDKGYFRDAGLDVELKFFDAAQPIAVATTSGDID